MFLISESDRKVYVALIAAADVAKRENDLEVTAGLLSLVDVVVERFGTYQPPPEPSLWRRLRAWWRRKRGQGASCEETA